MTALEQARLIGWAAQLDRVRRSGSRIVAERIEAELVRLGVRDE